MSLVIQIPVLNNNDESATLVEWLKSSGDFVKKGETICAIETTKSVADIEAESEGYLSPLFEAGEEVAVGAAIAVLMDCAEDDVNAFLESLKQPKSSDRKWTKKALLTAKRRGVDLEKLSEAHPGKVLNESDVLAADVSLEVASVDVKDLLDDKYPKLRKERVLLIGGGRGGGVVTLDALSQSPDQRAVGILDNDPTLHGKTMMGVPILGPSDMAINLWKEKVFDAAIIVVTANLDERASLFEKLKKEGVRFTNVIDPSVKIKLNVSLGVGNLIMGSSYLSSCVEIGDNNFFASHTCIEHHSIVGDHCTFGPRCTTSGAVTIGNRVKMGMGVLIEPYLSIGEKSLIPSGAVVTQNIPKNSVLKMQQVHSIHSRT